MVAPDIKGPEIKGWCPGALRPMESGDGWLVRIRPPMGMLTPAQAVGVAQAALRHGNGVIDLSSRANLQLRGVREGAHAPLIDDLRALGLVDDDARTEAARNLVITPYRNARTDRIAADLTQALAHAPALPGKFGFAVDTGAAPVLGQVSADIRLETVADGGLLLRADGMDSGMLVTESGAATAALALAEWFVVNQGVLGGRGRMAALIARGIMPDGHDMPALPQAKAPAPGPCADGMLVALAFGQLQADSLLALGKCDHNLILTPWRMILMQGAQAAPTDPALITRAGDPLLQVTACTGAPGCSQAVGPTRDLARALAPMKAGQLHVSGCTKGCAHPGKAELTLVATPNGYNLIRGGAASDAPHLTDLPPHLIAQHLKAQHAP
jgi:precorrin-3B synthase